MTYHCDLRLPAGVLNRAADRVVAVSNRMCARLTDSVVAYTDDYAESVPLLQRAREKLEVIARLGDRWRFLGPLDPLAEMPAFLGALGCLVLPSVNSTESFGLVQVEAMLSGTHVVASDLPGVRTVARTTGMGELAAPGDAAGLADAVGRVLEQPDAYARPRSAIEREYALATTVGRYEALFERLVGATAAWPSEEFA